jgi:hypothetical protein
MDVPEPRTRRRGFFLHVETPEIDHAEREAPEGVPVRQGSSRKATHAVRLSALSGPIEGEGDVSERSSRAFRSASETGSHPPGRMSR